MIIEVCRKTGQARLVSLTKEEILDKEDVFVLASSPDVLLDEKFCLTVLKNIKGENDIYFLVPESKNRIALKVNCDNKLNTMETVQKSISKFKTEVIYKKEDTL